MRRIVPELDQRILDITGELCLQLDISDCKPTFVSWESLDSRRRRGAEFPHDECLIEHRCVTLSERVKGVLEPDDWRPLIASSLISSKKLRKRMLRGLAMSVATFLLLGIALFQLGYLIILPIVGIFPLAALVVALLYTRRVRLIADRRAADLVSATAFLTKLNKIATSQNQGGVGEGQTDWSLWGLYLGKPNVRERISNLEAYSGKTEQPA